ncbi:hypothetical protein [Peptostreptococcus equinus]|uniref:Uncharacterized protein n=1 Tax=Peptostreptococcus equinus TaxID=3003601 RepID=A0ABY7JUH9_9FIRM|nr:hypothetical protein [Peptostreptococcus sp. CBA3647]WAW15753.1 hypothetical protein O0R46_04690 [Peptostreptococcus sp. CBA3647]
MKNTLLSQQYLISLIIGICSSLATTYFKDWLDRKHYKLNRLEERYFGFYLPFINLFNEHFFKANAFYYLEPEIQKAFYDLIVKCEYRFKDKKTPNLIYEFKCAYYIKDSPDFLQISSEEQYAKDLNETFINLSDYIFSAADKAHRKLSI